MKNYIVLAWIPGTSKFIAKYGKQVGFLDAASGYFDPDSSQLLVEAACSKYRYSRLGPFEVAPGGLTQFLVDVMGQR